MAKNNQLRPIRQTNRIFDWRQRRSWLASIRYYAGHVLTPELRTYLIQKRPECWSDDVSWLPDAKYILPELTRSLTSYYTHFKGFHGCRPLNLRSYYENGLIGQNSEFLCNMFREIFYDVPQEEVENVISQFADRGSAERGVMWLVGSDRFLVEECGHYLIQGSEYLMSLAANLSHSPNSEDYSRRLRKYGIPTVLEVDIPVSMLSLSQRTELAKMILSEWGQLLTRRLLSLRDDPPCYVIRQNIPSEYLRNHYHPNRITDPHKGRSIYINRHMTCDMCY
ncbi:hypothetical protein M2404_000612 [Rheinheimera pacifica]|nr:hypothetical protein [Rheinheimera pacifica]